MNDYLAGSKPRTAAEIHEKYARDVRKQVLALLADEVQDLKEADEGAGLDPLRDTHSSLRMILEFIELSLDEEDRSFK